MTATPTIDRRALLAALLAATAAGPALATSDKPLEARGYALGDMTLGDPAAKLTVIEYASLTCPHCAGFHNNSWPEIKERFVDSGQVHFIYRDVYFDQFGLWAAMVARCGGEDTFFDMLGSFYRTQSDWARSDDIVAELQRIGRLGGLSAERMQACLSDREFLERLVADYQANASADNVRSTPTFIIGGDTFTGNMPAADFARLIEERL